VKTRFDRIDQAKLGFEKLGDVDVQRAVRKHVLDGDAIGGASPFMRRFSSSRFDARVVTQP
jgi:hypothetical protein